MKTDAPLIHCLEELESLATEGQVHHLMQRPHILLFIEPELAQFPQLFLHKTSPSDRPARSGHSHIQWSFVSHRLSSSPRAPCLSVNAERLYFSWLWDSQRHWFLVVLSWFDTVVESTCSLSFANRAWVCGKVWLHVFSHRGHAPHKKWFFSKTTGSFYKQFSTM